MGTSVLALTSFHIETLRSSLDLMRLQERHFNQVRFIFVSTVAGDKVVTDVTANDGNWHALCVWWESRNGIWGIAKDGHHVDGGNGLATNKTIQGTIVISVPVAKDISSSFSPSSNVVTVFDLDFLSRQWSTDLGTGTRLSGRQLFHSRVFPRRVDSLWFLAESSPIINFGPLAWGAQVSKNIRDPWHH